MQCCSKKIGKEKLAKCFSAMWPPKWPKKSLGSVLGLQLATLTRESTPRHVSSCLTKPAQHIVRMHSWLGRDPRAKTHVPTYVVPMCSKSHLTSVEHLLQK